MARRIRNQGVTVLRRLAVLTTVSVAAALAVAHPAPAQAVVADQIRWQDASIYHTTLPAQRVTLDVWSSTPATKIDLLMGGKVVATDTTVVQESDHWAASGSVDLTGLTGPASITMRVTPPTGTSRWVAKDFTVGAPVVMAPDQIRWNGASIYNETVPAQPVALEVWSSTPASKVELLLGSRVMATDTTVVAASDHWTATGTVDLTGLGGSATITMRVTATDGTVRCVSKGFTVQATPTTIAPDQVRWNGASVHKQVVPGAAALPLDVWSATPATKLELLVGGAVVASSTSVAFSTDHWGASMNANLSGLPAGATTLVERITTLAGDVRTSTKSITIDPVIAALTSVILSSRPGATNTGVPAGLTLRASGPLTVTEAGTVLDGLDIRGCVVIDADDVTISRSRITCTDSPKNRAVRTEGAHTGLVITDTEVDGGGITDIGIDVSNVTMTRVNVHGTNDGIRLGSNITIQDSWVHDLVRQGELHPDAIQGISAQNVVIRHNALDSRDLVSGDRGNSAIQLGSETGTMISRDVLIEGNYLNGGNCTVNVRADLTGSAITLKSNRFGPDAQYDEVIAPPLVSVASDNVTDVWGTKIVVVRTS